MDVERYLEKGYKCFLVRDVPQYALREEVEVVCDDGECFGCVPGQGEARGKYREGQHYHNQQRHQPKTLGEMIGLGFSCVLTR